MTDSSEIEWTEVEGDIVTIGGSRRGVLFGELGPKHECSVPSLHSTSRADNFVEIEKLFPGDVGIEERLHKSSIRLPTEGEWELAFKNQLLSPIHGIEMIGDFVPERGYWGQPTDGRPKGPQGLQIIRDWKNGVPKNRFIIDSEKSVAFRLVRQNESISRIKWDGEGDPLPLGPDPIRRATEEVMIATLLGIIPSFIWAFFNASPDYIREGWPGLVLGGLFIGVFSAIFWRPPFPIYRKKSE